MKYTFKEENQEFFLRGKKISDTTIVVMFYVEVLDHFYQILQTFQKSVQLIFEDDVLIGYEVRYAKIDNNTIFEALKNQDEIKLDECFIQNFSFEQYATYCGENLYDTDVSTLSFPTKFSAKLSFWEGNTDFSKSKLGFVDFTFYGSFFGGQIVDFSSMEIIHGFFDLNRIYVSQNVYFSFSFTKIETGDIFLNSAYFEDGHRDFISLFLNKGDICFTNMFIDGGVVDISYSSINGILLCNKVYCKNLNFLMVATNLLGMDFSLSEFRDCQIYLGSSEIGDNCKNFSEIYLQNSILSFNNSSFGKGRIDFTYFEGQHSNVSFRNVQFFAEVADFSYMVCYGILNFSHANISTMMMVFTDAVLDVVSFEQIDSQAIINFRVQNCRFLSLKNAFIADVFDITSSVKFEYLQLSHLALTGRIMIAWSNNNVYKAINNVFDEEKLRINQKFSSKIRYSKLKAMQFVEADVFRILKENFNVLRRYTDEDESYIAYRRALRRFQRYDANPIRQFFLFLEWAILDILGGYGTDPWRTWIGIVFSWALFAGFYYYVDAFYIGESVEMTRMGRAMYHSAITFFTIGYGDIIPKGAAMRAMSGIEGFFGVIFTSYFMVAFTRKTLR